MSQELKLRIKDISALEKKLLASGAILSDETYFVDTYFNQPVGKVLKIVEKKSEFFVNMFEALNGKFEVVKDEALTDVEKVMQEYTSQFGVKRVLKGQRKFFRFQTQSQEFTLIFNLIENVGNFLIVTGENPSKKFVEKELGIKNPEYITVSFDELRQP